MLTIFFAAGLDRWQRYQAPLQQALADLGIAADITPDCPDPTAVDYIIYAPSDTPLDFARFPRAKAVLSLWAGVERILNTPGLTQPLCRMVDPSLTAGMVEWVTGHVLRHHLGMDQYILNHDHNWAPIFPPLASERPVTVLGLGALGAACATSLQSLGFPVIGWSRSAKNLPGLTTLHGKDGLHRALKSAAILVLLLPKTPQTENLMNAERLSWLPKGAVILNPGRGQLVDDAALLDALDSRALAHATLDVFRTEPLPKNHAFWAHPKVTVTPHVAAETRPASASRIIAENIRRGETGAPFLHLVDRVLGY